MISADSKFPGPPDAEPDVGGKVCFCGCGRPVKGRRPRANNALVRHMTLDLAMFQIAIDEDMVTEGAADLEALIAEGPPLIDRIRAYLHGEIERSDLDKKANISWSKRCADPRKVIAMRTIDTDWACNSGDVLSVVYGGRRVLGTIAEIKDTQMTINERPRLKVTVEVRPTDSKPFTLQKKFTFSRGSLPRTGDAVEIVYDPADPNDFVFRPAREVEPDQVDPQAAPDRISQLKDLAELREAGVLTDAEFEAEKQRILDS